MTHRVRDWVHAEGRPIPLAETTDYDADAIRLLLDELGEKYRHDFPQIVKKVARIKRKTGWVPNWNPRATRCSQGHIDPDWHVYRDSRGRQIRRCRECERVRGRKRAKQDRRRRG